MADSKQRGAMPPTDMARVAQQDIGKVARLFRDSGFRYRVFDSETGEHQIVDPVRPLPPMDHVPPVWPPPLSVDELTPPAPRPAPAPRVAPPAPTPAPVAPAVAKTVAPVVPPTVVAPPPETARAAVRAQTETDRIFRAVALGTSAAPAVAPVPAPAVAVAPPPPKPAPSAAPVAPAPKESNMSARPASPAESTARQMGRVVTLPSRTEMARPAPEAPAPDTGATPLRAPDGRSVATVLGNVLQPPAPPAKRPPASTAALMQQLFGARRKDG